MAKSYTLGPYSTDNEYLKYQIVVTEGTLSERSRPVTIKVQFWRTNQGYTTWASGTCYCKVGSKDYVGQAVSSSNSAHKITYNSYTTLWSGKTTINYNAAGDASLKLSAYINFNTIDADSNKQGGTVKFANIGALKYTISYNANGGSGAPSNQTKTHGTSLTLSSTKPTRTGYTFLGWSTSKTATKATYSAGGTYTANAEATLYAVWKINTYTISYNANGGSGAPASQTKTYGTNLKLSSTIPTRTGYTFLGWSTSKTATTATYSAGGTYSSNSAATLYAVWKINSFSLKINPNGGYRVSDGNTSVITVTKNYGATENISEIAKANYVLSGYTVTNTSSGSTTNLGGATFTFNNTSKTATFTQGTVACTLTAKWVLNAYTITFDANGGSGGPTTQIVEANTDEVLIIQKPTRTGYTFLGWSTSKTATTATYSAGGKIKLTGNIKLYAVWDIWKYTITFDANGGSGTVPKKVSLSGTATTTIGSEKPTAQGKTFILWNTEADGSGESYYPGDVWNTPSQSNITLYAMYLGTDIYFYKDGSIECIDFIKDTSVVNPQLRKDGRMVAAQFTKHNGGIIFQKGTVYANNFIKKETLVPGADAVG